MNVINIKKIDYEFKDNDSIKLRAKINKNFPAKMAENSCIEAIVLDSANMSQQDSTLSEEQRIERFVQSSIQKGLSYNFIVSKTGRIYKMTPEGLCAKSCVFENYSWQVSKLFPKNCPQHKLDLENLDIENIIDRKVISIVTESDQDSFDSGDNGYITEETNYSLKELIAYLIQEYGISAKKILLRSFFPKKDDLKQSVGHKYYKSNISALVMLYSYALMLSKKYEYELSNEDESNLIVKI